MVGQLIVSQLSVRRNDKPLFEDLSFRLAPGQALWVAGANGAGKSTLLRLLTGLASPDKGSIYWRGENITVLGSLYSHHFHYLAHLNGIKLGLTVIENLQLAAGLQTEFLNSVEPILSAVNLLAHRHTLARHLSAGQKRKLGLSRLWLIEKPLWILDEPFTALDVDTQAFFHQRITQHLERGGMAILSSHQVLDFPCLQVLKLS